MRKRSVTSIPHPVPHTRLPGMVWLRSLLLAVIGLFVFMLALHLVKEGAAVYGHTMLHTLQVSDATGALGLGWLLAMLFLSGSPVATLAIAFFSAGTIDSMQTLAMITGSRLGASFAILLVGLLAYVRERRNTDGLAIGVLTILTTACIYLPALIPGSWLLYSGWLDTVQPGAVLPGASWLTTLTDPLVALLSSSLPGWTVLVCGVATLLVALKLFDAALPEVDLEHTSSQRLQRFLAHPGTMFLLGALVTSVTLSVSVSIAVLVPLYMKGMVRREQALPYIMGANITTFIDTLVAAMLAGGPPAFTVVLVEVVSVTLISLLVLGCCYRPFERFILGLETRITSNHTLLVAFLVATALLPLLFF